MKKKKENTNKYHCILLKVVGNYSQLIQQKIKISVVSNKMNHTPLNKLLKESIVKTLLIFLQHQVCIPMICYNYHNELLQRIVHRVANVTQSWKWINDCNDDNDKAANANTYTSTNITAILPRLMLLTISIQH